MYSPLRRRLYRDSDDLIAGLGEQLAVQIGFFDAMAQIACDAETLVIECGPLHGLADGAAVIRSPGDVATVSVTTADGGSSSAVPFVDADLAG